MSQDFKSFQKISRLSRDIVITEKIDGTNGVIYIPETMDAMWVGSRTRWINPDNDNMGFARWAYLHEEELMMLGPGYHYGEWWGQKIQRGYGLTEKRFSLFNVSMWEDGSEYIRPACCHVVPVLYRGDFDTAKIYAVLLDLILTGSYAVPGYMNPEGIVIYHTASGHLYKKTIKNDDKHKGEI